MAYTFDPIFAVDPNNPANIAKNATITIFDPADPAQSPVAITDPTGSPLPNPITVDAAGMGPAYQHPTLARVGWKGAGFTGYFTSYEGMLNETIAAKSAAQDAIAGAQTAAAAAQTAASLVNAPADTTIATIINGATATKAALNNTYALKGEVPTNTLQGVVSKTAPASPVPGMIWFDTSVALTGIDAMANLLARWDATQLAYSDGASVASLEPRAGSSTAPLAQPATGNRPVLKTNVVNGLPVLRFAAGSQQWMDAAIPSTLSPVTVVSVFNASLHPTTVFSSGSATFASLSTSATGPSLSASSSGTGAVAATTPWSTTSGWWIVVQVINGASSKVYWRARTAANWTAGSGAGFPGQFRIGRNSSTNYSTMDIGEYMVFNAALADADVQTILTSLSTKYAITLGA